MVRSYGSLQRIIGIALVSALLFSCMGRVHTLHDKIFVEDETGTLVPAHGTRVILPGGESTSELRLITEFEEISINRKTVPEWLTVDVISFEKFDETRYVSTLRFCSKENPKASRKATIGTYYFYYNDVCKADIRVTQNSVQ